MTQRGIAVVLSGFPRHSETFALEDVSALDRQGLLAAVFSTKPGETDLAQPGVSRLRHRVHALSGSPDGQAAEAARYLDGTRVAGVHAYFAHRPADVAAALARSLDVPFGFSVHARDARKMTREALHDRGRRAACVVACNRDVAGEFDGSGVPVQIVPHGVDLRRFATVAPASGPVFRLLAVGRLVEKKGFAVLLGALTAVREPWRLHIVGDGPQRERLAAQARGLGLSDRVTFLGTVTHDALPAEYGRADAVIVPSVLDSTGDRDGLPNVVLEAMASGLAIVATDMGAIASAIRDDETGVLVPAGDAAALGEAIDRLARTPRLRVRLGGAAREAVERDFDVRDCTRRLALVLREAYA